MPKTKVSKVSKEIYTEDEETKTLNYPLSWGIPPHKQVMW